MAKSKLHQILAAEQGVRQQASADVAEVAKILMTPDLLKGQTREYQPAKEDGEKYETERQVLQDRVPDLLKRLCAAMERSFDMIATRDYANMHAKADVTVDGTALLSGAPVSYLLWLEGRLQEIHKLIIGLPVLPADIEWAGDVAQKCFVNKHQIRTAKTSKVAYPLVLYEATDKHPAQVQKEVRDEIVGHWTTLRYSGAITVTDQRAMKDRCERLQIAVKHAREQANTLEVENAKVTKGYLKYIFGGLAGE